MPRSPRNLLFLSACLLALPSGTPARPQTADSAVSLTPGPEPPDVPIEWKQLVGIYGYGQDKATAIILERDERLFFQDSKGATNQIQEQKPTLWFDGGDGRTHAFTEDPDASGSVTALHHLLESYTRVDAGSDPAHFYRVRPVKPIDQLRAAALAERPPEEAGPFRKPELAELAALDSGFHFDTGRPAPLNTRGCRGNCRPARSEYGTKCLPARSRTFRAEPLSSGGIGIF